MADEIKIQVNLRLKPIEYITINLANKLSLEEICETVKTPSGLAPLFWADGLLLSIASAPLSEEMIKEHIEGKLHWFEVNFTELPEYKPFIDLGYDKIPVRNVSYSYIYKLTAKWLKESYKMKIEEESR